MTPYVARWDLDKTYLRTEFDTVRDLLRTAFEKPTDKRTVPGAAPLLREIAATGAAIHILSGSPEQLRSRIEEKLRLDGARWDSLTLKPNLNNILRFRFRAVKDQLGYKLPALLAARGRQLGLQEVGACAIPEVLLGDDAESDAFVYSLYADTLAGRISDETLEAIMRRGRSYADTIADTLRLARLLPHSDVVSRILIHLDRQTPPSDFALYGARLVPFFNYLQAALILHEDGKLPSTAVIRVAIELVVHHGFDAHGLARSYFDLERRGHLAYSETRPLHEQLAAALADLQRAGPVPCSDDIEQMLETMATASPRGDAGAPSGLLFAPTIDYLALADRHSRRRKASDR